MTGQGRTAAQDGPPPPAETRIRPAEPLDVLAAIHSTRSFRYLRPDPVPEDVLWAILDAAIRGPSSGNAQPWGWVVVTDPVVKGTIGGWYLEEWQNLGHPSKPWKRMLKPDYDRARRLLGRRARTEPAAFGVDPRPDRNRLAGDHLARHLADAPMWVIPVLLPLGRPETPLLGAEIYGATQNLMLAARAFGLGSTLTMLHARREKEVARLLGLPSGARTMALIPLGYPARGQFSEPKRRPVDEVSYWERWGQTRSRVRASSGDAGEPGRP